MQKNNGTTPKHVTLKNKFDKTKKGQKPSVIQPPTSNPSKSSLPPTKKSPNNFTVIGGLLCFSLPPLAYPLQDCDTKRWLPECFWRLLENQQDCHAEPVEAQTG